MFIGRIYNYRKSNNRLPVKSAVTVCDFEVRITNRDLTVEIYRGSLSFESSCLKGVGSEAITVEKKLFVIFTFGEAKYNELFWELPWNNPFVTFQDGNLIGLQWWNPLFILETHKFKFWSKKEMCHMSDAQELEGVVSYSELRQV